jgi:hypothetical protein
LRSLTAAALLALCSCGGASSAPEIPYRKPTAVEPLLAVIPAGPDLLVEADIQRVRANAEVGKVLSALSAPASRAADLSQTGYDLLRETDQAVLAVYDIGDTSRQIIAVRARRPPPGARQVGEDLYAIGDDDLLARSEAVAVGAEPSVQSDTQLLVLRARAMPEAAESASLRMALRLDFDARVHLASQVSMSEVPVSISGWADVVDDLALVAELGAANPKEAIRLRKAARKMLGKLARLRSLRLLGLSPALVSARVEGSNDSVRVVLLLSPGRLRLVVSRILQHFQDSST